MKSVPPRGSGWVFAIADCKFQIANLKHGQTSNRQSAIENRQSQRPTRYREVVLTSCHSFISDTVSKASGE